MTLCNCSWKRASELLAAAEKEGRSLAQMVLQYQAGLSGQDEGLVRRQMAQRLKVMRAAAAQGLKGDMRSPSGLIGGGAKLLEAARQRGKSLSGGTTGRAIVLAMAIAEVNACMGRIVAAPTAGSCGILPGVLLALQEEKGWKDEVLVDGLFAAAGIGIIVGKQASLAGAALGCQAECGVASAMAAAAAVEMAGGTPRQALDAAAIALKGWMGLVCDPVGGLVEIPCVKRNAIGTAHALAAADIALAGVPSFIPLDEVVTAMVQVGRSMPPALRETGEGGVAACPSARALMEGFLGRE
ncbi:L-serine ammonia-lyase, iron-sulfur-dependent, subunit alpha [Thermanaeromonas sp. C210]|uniref:L-serine ammonia-lyase, iron-sulfur-dependent, subunit alpha n=1 Tax=Thermanaeromonas sp. C210 TaxID=2731925 RepID=UPI00155BAE3E|nr:L-serine ammonia-lyase, iron-sulfur-dependent, subunit alpha [Thermanaeromonas sp. C210]GFN22340.1 L-serine dehydratase, iron-sulfur-dependent subunit alpha [Thermanaeromonas sp. C210]